MRTNHLLLCVAFITCGAAVVAQDTRLSIGLEAAMPVGDMGDAYTFGIGGTLGFELPVGPVGVLAQAGFISFSGESTTLGTATFTVPNLQVIPVQVGGKYYFISNQLGPYLGALLGVHMTNCDGCEASTNLSYAPMAGFMITEKLDIGLRYQFMTAEESITVAGVTNTQSITNSYIGLRAAIGF
jgi:hypothetical protein